MAILSSKPEHPYQAILRVVHKVGDLEEGEYSPHALVPIKLLHPEVATSTQEEHLYVYKAVIEHEDRRNKKQMPRHKHLFEIYGRVRGINVKFAGDFYVPEETLTNTSFSLKQSVQDTSTHVELQHVINMDTGTVSFLVDQWFTVKIIQLLCTLIRLPPIEMEAFKSVWDL